MKIKLKSESVAISLGVILIVIVFSLFVLGRTYAIPYGANSSVVAVNNSLPDSPMNLPAQAGNITELNLFGYSTTQSWQGFYGNVTGVLQLGDSSENVMYNWTDLSPKGEVYASTNSSVDWASVQCFNFTADGSYGDDSANAGATSLYGTNISQLQSEYNISSDDADSASNTFTRNDHALFYTGSLMFISGQCKNMKVYNSTGAGTYDEVLLYEPTKKSVIFASILQNDANGFNNKEHDFEMLVLENGRNGDVATTNYYFYLELQ